VTRAGGARRAPRAALSPRNCRANAATPVSATPICLRGGDSVDISADVFAIVARAAEAARLRQSGGAALKSDVVPVRDDPGMTGVPRLERAVGDRLIGRRRRVHEDVVSVGVGVEVSRERPGPFVGTGADPVVLALDEVVFEDQACIRVVWRLRI